MSEPPPKPGLLHLRPDNIPLVLRTIRAWVGWRFVFRIVQGLPGRWERVDRSRQHSGYAIYDRSWFFTYSGSVLPGSGDICDLTLELADLHRELFSATTALRKGGRAGVGQHAKTALSLDESAL